MGNAADLRGLPRINFYLWVFQLSFIIFQFSLQVSLAEN